MKIINTELEKKERKWYYAAFFFSLTLHIALTQYAGIVLFQSFEEKQHAERKTRNDVIKYRFVETRVQDDVRKDARELEEISDKDSRANSRRESKVKDEMPEGEIKEDVRQLEKIAAKEKRSKKISTPEKFRKFSFDKTSLVKKDPLHIERSKSYDVPDRKEPSLEFPGNSIIDMPVISLGQGADLEFENISFLAAETEAGKYFSKVKQRIEHEWYKYMTFNYRTNNVLGSEALIIFKIAKDGRIVEMEKKYISGDFLFKDYCETAILNSGPFNEIPEAMDNVLEQGVLDISIYFGYDVSAARRKKREENGK